MQDKLRIKEYRHYLASKYYYKFDENTYEARKYHIDSHYTDDFIGKIINDTDKFCDYLLDKMEDERNINEDGYITTDEKLDSIIYIYNECVGGIASDQVYCFKALEEDYSSEYVEDNIMLVSKYLLESFFVGFTCLIDDCVEEEIEEDIGFDNYNILERLSISGSLKNYKEIRRNHKGIQKVKKRKYIC